MPRRTIQRKSKWVKEATAAAAAQEEPEGSGPAALAKPAKKQLTHFLCVPLVNASSETQLRESLKRFKDEVVSAGGSTTLNQSPIGAAVKMPVIAESAFRPLGTIHLTIGVMSLTSEDRVREAVDALQSLDLRAMMQEISPGPEPGVQTDSGNQKDMQASSASTSASPVVALTSLHTMRSPRKTSMLFAAPSDPSNTLYPLCQNLRSRFTKAGLLVEENRVLQLHATVVNTVYAKSHAKRARSRVGIPASQPPTQKNEQSASTVATATEDAPAAHAGSTTLPSSDAGEQRKETEDGSDDSSEDKPDTSERLGRNARPRREFDARALVERYKDHVWASDVRIEKIAICKMGAKRVKNDRGEVVAEQYEEVASVRF